MSATPRDLVGIGASAGGIPVLRRLLDGLPADLPATVFITLHRSPSETSSLVQVLGRGARLCVKEPDDGEAFEHGRVYIAPADHHMVVSDRLVFRQRTPKYHHTRPAIDPMFASLAASHGRRVIGVLLSGNLSDGVEGLLAIKARRGISLVQEPGEAPFPSMPRDAILYDHVDLVFETDVFDRLLEQLVRGVSVEHAAQRLAPRVRRSTRLPST